MTDAHLPAETVSKETYLAAVSRIDRLEAAIRHWAAFQEEDSLLDQRTDIRLAAEAQSAHYGLLELVR